MDRNKHAYKSHETSATFDWEHIKKEHRRLNTNIEQLMSSVQNYLLTTSKQFAEIQSKNSYLKHSASSYDIPKNITNCCNQIKSDIDEVIEKTIIQTKYQSTKWFVYKKLDILLKKCIAFKQVQPAQLSIIKRYKEILEDQKKEFKRIQSGIQQNSDKMKLFASVQLKKDKDLDTTYNDEEEKFQQSEDDLEQHRQNAVSLNQGLSTANSIIQMAGQVRNSLNFQTSVLSRANQTVENMNKQLPSIGDLVGAIKRARHKRAFIYYAVILFCMFIICYQVISSRSK